MMGFNCKGICVRSKAITNMGNTRYSEGQKRCTVCSIFIVHDGLRCPCCRVLLRSNAKFSKTRNKTIHLRI